MRSHATGTAGLGLPAARTKPALGFLLIIAVAFCVVLGALSRPATAGDWKGKEETKDGAVHIMNPAEPMEAAKTVGLKELWRIGGDTDDEDEFFGVISSIMTDKKGNVYLLDTQLNQIKIFSPSGEFIRAIGREGEGPGEFRLPVGMFFTPDGNIGVMQAAPGKIVLLTPEGEPAGEHPMPKSEDGGFFIFFGGQSRAKNLVLALAVNSFAEGRFQQTRYLASIDAEGKEKARYCSDVRTIEMSNPVMDDMAWDTFDRRWTIGTDGRVYAVVTYPDYRINVWKPDGTPERIIERAYTHRKRSDKELEVVKNLMGVFAKRIPNATVKVTDYTKDIENIFVRDDGSLWVMNSNGMRDRPKGSLGVFDVFDATGHFVRTVTLNGEGDPETDAYHFVGNRLYVVTDLLQAAIALQSGGESFSLGEEKEPEPMSVICYDLGDGLQTSQK